MGLVLVGIAFFVFACHPVREPQPDIDFGEVEPRFVLGSIILTVGLGGIVFAALSRPSPFVVQALVVMLGLAVRGWVNGTGQVRPLIALVQFPAISLPIGVAFIRFWPAPSGVGAGVGLLVVGLLCVSMARSGCAAHAELMLAREAPVAERQRL